MPRDRNVNHNHNNAITRLYFNRIRSLVTRLPATIRSLDILWTRNGVPRDDSGSQLAATTPSADETSLTRSNGRSRRPPPPPPPVRRESNQSLFTSTTTTSVSSSADNTPVGGSPTHINTMATTTATSGHTLPSIPSRPPHSHLYQHSSHYPLLLGHSYNQWPTSGRDSNSFVSHMNHNNNNNTINTIVDKERNVLSAIMSIVVIATLATALAQPKWFSITGGVCPRKYIGLQEFFYVGNFNNYHFDINKVTSVNTGSIHNRPRSLVEPPVAKEFTNNQHMNSETILMYGLNGDLKNCVTPEIVTLQRLIIGLCFFAIMFNLIQFFFDTLGVHKKWLNAIRAHALGNILGVLLCVVIVGVSYLVSTLLEKQQHRLLKEQHEHRLSTTAGGTSVIMVNSGGAGGIPSISSAADPASNHVEVKFELSYYLVTFSGLLAIIAAASNLLRRPHHYYIDANDFWTDDPIDDELMGRNSLVDTPSPTHNSWQPYPTPAFRPMTTFPAGPPPGMPPPSMVSTLPPPPPYEP